MNQFMKLAIEEARRGFNRDDGGPFGAVILKDGVPIASAHNEVLKTNDPTAHAEITAIRAATHKLQRFKLTDCDMYSTCEPCPMCLGAIYWSGISIVYYGNTRDDAEKYGFDDSHIYQQISMPVEKRLIRFLRVLGKDALEAFKFWDQKTNKIQY